MQYVIIMIDEIAGYHLIKIIYSNGADVWLAKKNNVYYAIKTPKIALRKTLVKKDLEDFREKVTI